MRADELYKLPCGYDFCGFPEFGEMPRVAGDEIVGARFISAFEEDVVGRIARSSNSSRWRHQTSTIFNEVQKLELQASSNAQFTTP